MPGHAGTVNRQIDSNDVERRRTVKRRVYDGEVRAENIAIAGEHPRARILTVVRGRFVDVGCEVGVCAPA